MQIVRIVIIATIQFVTAETGNSKTIGKNVQILRIGFIQTVNVAHDDRFRCHISDVTSPMLDFILKVCKSVRSWQTVALNAIQINAFWTAGLNSSKLIGIVLVRWTLFHKLHEWNRFKANCPNGCPCDSYECNGISPGFEIAGPITIGESQKVEEISVTVVFVDHDLWLIEVFDPILSLKPR